MRAAAALAAVALIAAAAPAAAAEPGRIAVGAVDGASVDDVAARAEVATGVRADRTLSPLGAVVVAVEDVDAALPGLRALPGVDYAEPVTSSRRLAFRPDDPLVPDQWYLNAINAFSFWEGDVPPQLTPVRVAVVDSGYDGDHPDLVGRVAASKSFVRGPASVDTIGHGTMVAGEIAASVNNGYGIAGVGFPVELLVAKVVGRDGTIDVEDEANAIRWAVQRGAQVINLSLGGPRDPREPPGTDENTYHPLEQAAIEFAHRRGVVVVAATGNCEQARCRYANYPAALPHVIGVSALHKKGAVGQFSNGDSVYNDLSAPGVGILSTFPIALTDDDCVNPGFSDCARNPVYRAGQGTSFAAPLVSAAAALVLSLAPGLRPNQVADLLVGTATDLGVTGRDAGSGAGRLDVYAALQALALGEVGPPDTNETNDDAGKSARTLYGKRPRVDATIDYFDDPNDVYRVRLRKGQRAVISLTLERAKAKATLVLWWPGTEHVTDVTAVAVRSGRIAAYRRSRKPVIRFDVPKTGWYFVEVKAPKRTSSTYRLVVDKR